VSTTYEVREYQKGDEEQIIELLEQAFPHWPGYNIQKSKLDFWKWKYFKDNNLRGIVVAESQGKIIGCGHGVNREIKIGNGLYLMRFGGDVAVHQDYRRMGIYGKMRDLSKKIRRENGVDMVFSATTNPIMIESGKKRGSTKFPQEIIEMVFIDEIEKENLGLMKSVGYKVFKSWKKRLVPKSSEGRFTVTEVSEFGEETDRFWTKIKDDYNFIINRDSSNLNWRYCDPRSGYYKVLAVYENDELYGYSVLTTQKRGEETTQGIIVDFCTLPSVNEAAFILLKKTVNILLEDVNRITYLASNNHPNVSVFSKQGFIARPPVFAIDYFFISDKIKDDSMVFQNSSPEKLFLQYGDTDVI